MQTFTFNELDERGQENAINLYSIDSISKLMHENWTRDEVKQYTKLILSKTNIFSSWRFTIHGERVI